MSYQQRLQIEFEVNARRPRQAVAYGLGVFLGVFGAHRFYLGDGKTAIIMLITSITIIGLPLSGLWALADLFRIPGMIRKRSDDLREQLLAEATV